MTVAGSLLEKVKVDSRLEEAVAVGSGPRGVAALGARPEAAAEVACSLPEAVAVDSWGADTQGVSPRMSEGLLDAIVTGSGLSRAEEEHVRRKGQNRSASALRNTRRNYGSTGRTKPPSASHRCVTRQCRPLG